MTDDEIDCPTPAEWNELAEAIREDSSDRITGNMTGSYYCNAYKARQAIDKSGLLWSNDFRTYVDELGSSLGEILDRGAEVLDVWARCWALQDLVSFDEIDELIRNELHTRKTNTVQSTR